METMKIMTEEEIDRENSIFFNPEYYERELNNEFHYSSEIPYGLFTTENDKISLNSLVYYKTLIQDLGIQDYIFEMYKLTPFDDGLIICNGIIICNELCFFNHNQIVKYFDFFVLFKKFIFHLTDEIGLRKDVDFSCNEWLAEYEQEIRFTVRESTEYIKNCCKSSFIIDTKATEERLQIFLEIEFRDNERYKNYQIAKNQMKNSESPHEISKWRNESFC